MTATKLFEECWTKSVLKNVEMISSGSSGIRVESNRNSHFYVGMNRSDLRFEERPPEPSFPFEAGSTIRVAVDVLSSDVALTFSIVEYSAAGNRPHFYDSNIFDHKFDAGALSFTLAVRIKGRGFVELNSVSVEVLIPVDEFERQYDVRSATAVAIDFSAWGSQESETASLITFSFSNDRDEIILPYGDLAVHPKLGLYRYLHSSKDISIPAKTHATLRVPAGATKLSLTGKAWKREVDVYLADEPILTLVGREDTTQVDESIEDFVASIPDDESLVVLYTTAPQLGHPTLSLRPNRLAKEYLEMGYWVVFFPFSKVPDGQSNQGERARQFSRDRLHQFLTAAKSRPGHKSVFICSSFPDIAAATAIDLLKLHGWRTTYEVRDDMEEFNRVGYSKWFNPQLERRVCANVDTVITVSPRLALKMDVLRGAPGYSIVVPNAVNEEFIVSAERNRTAKNYERRSAERTVGYLGHLTPSWFDWSLIITAAEELRDVRFEIIGHGKPEDLRLPKNVIHLGPRTHAEFREISETWKVGLIPFKPSTLTFAVDPNKIYEYLAVGLRVVTAPMGSVSQCPSTYIYERRSDFIECLGRALDGPIETSEQKEIAEFLKTSSWRARAERMVELMGIKNET